MEFEEILKKNGQSLTRSRREVFELLKSSDQPMGVSDVIVNLPSMDRSTIYRTIDLFEELGIVKRVWFGFKSKIELSDEFQDHHHHIICEKCGKIENIDHAQLEQMISRISVRAGFKPTTHHIEIMGLCRNCSRKK